ncbi:hypothetical protein [Cellulosimicrobium sp. NPDC057127]|uniref:hypothetical protein n=1 Tax=Cellulosimicrobium sp. NPDC057127 TaxID=3346026 RepID=UPI00364592D1
MSHDDESQRGDYATTGAATAAADADLPGPRTPASGPPVRRVATLGVVVSLLVTLAFVGLDLAYRLGGGVADDPTSRAKIDEDGSFAEITAWVVMIVAAAVLANRAVALPRAPVLWAWAGMLVVVTADDSLMIHETAGGALARSLGWSGALGLDAQGWGELAVWGVIGVVVGTALLVTFLRSGPLARRASGYLLGCVAVLGVGAVGVDMVAIVVEPYVGGTLSWVIAAAESAGELLAAGLFLTVAVCLLVATPRDRTP